MILKVFISLCVVSNVSMWGMMLVLSFVSKAREYALVEIGLCGFYLQY